MDMKRDYYEDVQFLKDHVQKFWFVVLILALAVLPLFIQNYTVYVVNFLAVNVIVRGAITATRSTISWRKSWLTRTAMKEFW